jgi:hypothetical protein
VWAALKVPIGLWACLLLGCKGSPPPRPDPVVAVREAAHGPGAALETVTLAGKASTRTTLDRGELYLLKATGVVTVGTRQQDAEFAFAPDGSGAADAVGALDVGIDVGCRKVLPALGRQPAPPSPDRLKWFGAFRPDHVYYSIVPGAGAPLSLALVAPGAVTGTLTVSLYRLSPAPPAVGAPLETLMVPAREKITVRSAVKAAVASVYLLQAVGEVQVGGPGAMGDAEFHDYHADGRGYNEGEAGVDFGVGVDQPDISAPGAPSTGKDHPQRRLKWGQFRPDHTYYMLYAGRGDAIALNYHDSGGKSGVYKDNDGFLPVSIFAVP